MMKSRDNFPAFFCLLIVELYYITGLLLGVFVSRRLGEHIINKLEC